MTATEMVSWALQLIRVVDPAEALTDYQYNGGRRALNALLRRWEANGVALGFQPVDNPADPLTIPEEAEEAVAYNLAVRLRTLYGATLEQDVALGAQAGYAALLRDVYTAMPPIQIVSQPRPANWWGTGWTIQSGGPIF
ncbi:MAG TPA: packaged DNA stabilization gp4 family protein [Gammaproteobacteria bacterium]|nr:packaged DNA stabilization gp4 family protein [Gammaproteobacteria bacterium]